LADQVYALKRWSESSAIAEKIHSGAAK
jgi:hypothetical protein